MLNERRIIKRTKASMEAAKARAMFFWSYVVFHPEVRCKSDVPKAVYDVLRNDQSLCPLCSVFRRVQIIESCTSCPLVRNGKSCVDKDGLFYRWHELESAEAGLDEDELVIVRNVRRLRARDILEAIRDWNTTETEEEV